MYPVFIYLHDIYIYSTLNTILFLTYKNVLYYFLSPTFNI
jgi:hypothetical protein